MLPSPVMAEDRNDEFDETLKLSLDMNSNSLDFAFEVKMFGLVKSITP